ncbi:hypothetical protein [Cypionkella sp.]|uniref:hypothetical protein n=1 Tax=Cypionkella sp. TaxID=2811411 RepID=UPI002716D96E|nr:hypothetical protein [Cypionkella sp.]MDO8986009.1 hypothetical protein [Cypionkella sp.]MDP2048197.1 hypothetical protein [Cypionkella sp.]
MLQLPYGGYVDRACHESQPHTYDDAEIVAATLARMPDSLGGKRMAIYIAELTRWRMTADWLPGVVPRSVPVEAKRNQHGERSTTVVVGTERVPTRAKWRTVKLLACPVTWRPHPEQIASACLSYEDWWHVLDWVRGVLLAGRMLREVEVTVTGPIVRPCRKGITPWPQQTATHHSEAVTHGFAGKISQPPIA